jgi:hypothetical protein
VYIGVENLPLNDRGQRIEPDLAALPVTKKEISC